MKIRIKIQGALVFLGLGAIILFSSYLLPGRRNGILDYALDTIGIALILFGFLFRISARGYKEEKSDNSDTLVKDGPYAIIRNPMYLGTFMIGAGVVMMLLELWFIFLFVGIFLLIYIPQIKKEEVMLLKKFGQEYKEYCKITPKYFPRVDYLLRLNKYVSLKSFWVKKEIVSMIATLTIVILLEIWKYARLFGYK
jgi:protein-S-isoprenylcysteine O-methyltransferase Ste14